MNWRWQILFLSLMLNFTPSYAKCEGNFVNPITDICWDCFFPITIGNFNITPTDGHHDTDNPSMPVELCIGKDSPIPRAGLNIGFWEPFALTDVTSEPYCMVNLGGFKMELGNAGHGCRQGASPKDSAGFHYVHWYKYPLLFWLNLITSIGCYHGGDFDIAWLAELDPTWNDDEMAFILNPEAILFGNPVAQAACAADALKAQVALPIDKLFWCAGTQGSLYPFTGRVSNEKGPIQAAVLLSERMDYKLHRQLLIEDSSPDAGGGFNGPICTQHLMPIMPKTRYRYQMTNTIANAKDCYQFGHDVINWEAGHNRPDSGNAFGFLIWKKRNCTFL